MKKKLLIDCDTGTDDAIALMAALYSRNAEVRAVTTVAGNVPVTYTYQNTLNLLRYLEFDVPVAKGAARPLKLHSSHFHAEETHGVTGLGGIVLPECKEEPSGANAAALLFLEACKAKGELEVIATGPLTNIAVALLLYPELSGIVKHLFIMGGAMRGGNVSPASEFNMWCDPEAARIVLESGIYCTFVGLDVTEKARLDTEDIADMRGLHTKAGDITAELLAFMKEREKNGGEGLLMHDALAVAAALCPECLEYETYGIDVECEGKFTYGHTEMMDINDSRKAGTARVAVQLNLPVFKQWLHGIYNSVRRDS